MAQNQKLVVLLVLCTVFVAAVQLLGAEARADPDSFKVCYESCHDTCKSEGHGFKYCYPKCREVCKKEHYANFESQKH